MKRKLSIIGAAVLLAACAGFAEPDATVLSVATGTNTAGSATDTTISGYIEEIVLELPTGTAVTGTVVVTATPPIGSAITLASKTIAATTLIRPRLDGTGTAGAALTNDPPWRYLSYGDTITAAVSSANRTGLTWRVRMKYDRVRR
jgi:hypothetical protein